MFSIVIKRWHIYIFTLVIFFLASLSIIYIRVIDNTVVSVSNTNSHATINLNKINEYSYIVLIIDDFGNNTNGTDLYKNLRVPFTAAVMPNMPFTDEESLFFSQSPNDVILHMPMQSKTGKTNWAGVKPITVDQSEAQIRENLLSSISQIHGIVGINNHMGSKAMESERVVNVLLQVSEENDLIVIDSKTTAKSLPRKLSNKYDVTVFERDVFLDSITLESSKIKENLKRAAKIAKEKGYAIAIGHVGPSGGKVTANAINEVSIQLEKENIKFITISELNKMLKNDSN